MTELNEAERFLLDAIRRGDGEAWSQLVERYQGRLLAFAQQKLGRPADAEDLVQEAFMGFLKGLPAFQELASVETYLFTILRRRIIDFLRGKHLHACLLHDLVRPAEGEGEPLGQIVSPEMTASWYVRRDEQADLRARALAMAMRELVGKFKETQNFRDLQAAEMLFYCQLPNKEVARLSGMTEPQVALLKHRCLKHVRQSVARELHAADPSAEGPAEGESTLTEVWEAHRLSCLKRSTIGSYVLGTLEKPWRDYADFHLNRLGCRFCLANLEDLRRQTGERPAKALRNRIMQSTVGFLRST